MLSAAGAERTDRRQGVDEGNERMERVIIVGLEAGPAIELGSGEIQILHVPDAQSAFCAMEESSPRVLVAATAIDDRESISLMDRILLLHPEFRGTLITVDRETRPGCLRIREWDQTHQRFSNRIAAADQLAAELRAACGEAGAPEPDHDALARIGYYRFLEQGRGQFHVQTEVIPGRPPRIKTTVHLGGAIVDVVQTHPPDRAQLADIVQIAESQQEQAIQDVENGKFD